jgi:hypothetical protein
VPRNFEWEIVLVRQGSRNASFHQPIFPFYTDSNPKRHFAACLPYGKTSSFFTSCRPTLNWKPYYTDSNPKRHFAACLPYGKTSSFFTSCRATLNWNPKEDICTFIDLDIAGDFIGNVPMCHVQIGVIGQIILSGRLFGIVSPPYKVGKGLGFTFPIQFAREGKLIIRQVPCFPWVVQPARMMFIVVRNEVSPLTYL